MDRKNILIPVIHTLDKQQVLENVEKVVEWGGDAVMLNNHPSSYLYQKSKERLNSTWELLDVFLPSITSDFPTLKVWINDLSIWPKELFTHLGEKNIAPDMIRVDQPLLPPKYPVQLANDIQKIQKEIWRKGQYFGSVNFKYQPHHFSQEELLENKPLLLDYVDIITTSWIGTWKAADLDKIEMFSSVFWRENLALASWVDSQNYRSYKNWVKYFLVATGLQIDDLSPEEKFHYLDTDKIKKLNNQILMTNLNHLAKPLYNKKISQELSDLLISQNIINIAYDPTSNSLASILSNLYPSNFMLDGENYASVEAFWTSIKFPVGDARREQAKSLFGLEAKRFAAPMQWHPYIYYQGKRIDSGSEAHQKLMKKALVAKFSQNPILLEFLKNTANSALVHIPLNAQQKLYTDSKNIPGEVFSRMIFDIRESLKNEK